MKKTVFAILTFASILLVGCDSNKSDDEKCREDGDRAACERVLNKALDDASRELDKASKQLNRDLNNIKF